MRGIFGSMFAASSSEDSISLTDSADRWFGTGDGSSLSKAGTRVNTDTAMRVSAVYGCVNLLSKTVAALPLRMYRTEYDPKAKKWSSEEAPNHPLNDILEYEPNRWQTAFDFRAMMQMDLSLRGNAFAEIISGPRGFADRLEVIRPDQMQKVEKLDNGTLRYTFTDENKRTVVKLQDEIMHLRSAIAPRGLLGVSPVTYARETIGLALATEEHGSRLFSNGARPSGVVTVEKRMSDPAFERFKKEWNRMYMGLANSGKVPVLEEGAKFSPISLTNEDAQFLATREFEIEEVARWFDVPLVLLHHMTKTSSWGTGVEAIMLAFVRNNLMPWLKCWTLGIRRDLILAPQLYEARFDVDELQRGDSKATSEFFSKLVTAGIIVRNEAREALGYNSLPGLDEPLVPNSNAVPQNSSSQSDPNPTEPNE